MEETTPTHPSMNAALCWIILMSRSRKRACARKCLCFLSSSVRSSSSWDRSSSSNVSATLASGVSSSTSLVLFSRTSRRIWKGAEAIQV